MKKWYVEGTFIRQGKEYDAGYYIREDGFVEWTEPIPNGETYEFPIDECFHPVNPFSSEPGDPIRIEDGKLIGKEKKGGIKMVKVSLSERDFLENFPKEGEAYAILESDDRYAFAWGTKYPYANELPETDVVDESGGVKWFGEENEVRDYIEDVAMKPIPPVDRLYYDYDVQEWFSVEDILDWAIYTAENRFSHNEIGWPYHFIEALGRDHREALIQKGKEYEPLGWKVAPFREAFWDGKEWVLNDESEFVVVVYQNPV